MHHLADYAGNNCVQIGADDRDDGALFEVLVWVRSDAELLAIVLQPSAKAFASPRTRFRG